MSTTITVSDHTWEELNKRKKRGDSMDDVLGRMILEFPEEKE